MTSLTPTQHYAEWLIGQIDKFRDDLNHADPSIRKQGLYLVQDTLDMLFIRENELPQCERKGQP